jgi:hypothetical protein
MNSIACGTDCLRRRGPHYDSAAMRLRAAALIAGPEGVTYIETWGHR